MRNTNRFFSAAFICTIGLSSLATACVSSSPRNAADDDAGGDTSGSTTANTGGGGGSGATGGGGTVGSGGEGGSPYEYAPPELSGQVFLGHYLGDYELFGFQTADLSPIPGTPIDPGAPTSTVVGIAKHDVVVVALEGGDSIQVYGGPTMGQVAGSPYGTGYGPVDVAHDDARDRLYVYCIGTEGDPSKSLLTVYDTGTLPWQELPGSPFDIDVPAIGIDVDPVTGAVFGVSLTTYWGVKLEGDSVVHFPGSPVSIANGTGADVAIDPERRRVYVGERIIGQDQRVHVLDADDFSPHQRSPVQIPGASLGDFALNPVDGELWVVDFGTSKLHSIQAEPLMRRDSCGTNGCSVPTTETGIAVDYERDRLFLVHVPSLSSPDDGNGFLTAWDISDPVAPTEITQSGARPTLGVYPVWATAL